ncbi:hypothetical protein M409DRAFT_24341 [Zasmidium cellare ATCC 36951]|uniref:Heterokaryon incompatibility domain-containing protein n=1 Tax=Zasmidium cellare ATCC 36951 TaxID=1080233 RepID=A0A6A6CH31_ZASCE|nr:uncharacterized protein M409DRAFT_24341 [Zasmidium cellare ATCC 36951]KAF2165490.1 hypothetical protein M409DRAFT_24341 [Zasmidium cellare ATCC 36951]
MTPCASPNFCGICQVFNVRALLLAAEASAAKSNIDDRGLLRSTKEGVVHDAIPKHFKHQPGLHALKAASSSCDLCRSIWREFSRQREPAELTDEALCRGIGNEQIYIGTLVWDAGLNATPHVAVIQHGPPPHNSQRQLACFEVCADYGALPSDNSRLLARLQASSSKDEQCFDLARTWMRNCQNEHVTCGQSGSRGLRLPTRLLAVGSDDADSKSDGLVRLVQGSDCSGAYTALSYCWGPDRDLILTHEAEERLRSGIPIDEFPATLRDAICVTRQMDIPYIWIDALCIFQDQERQDSKDDWAREAGRMRDVYRGAAITIEAASASRGGEGFLKERTSSKPYCALPWEYDAKGALVYLRPIIDIPDNQLLGTKIFTRAWTLQERLLAPRTISFGTQQISFECANGFVDETGRSSLLPRATESYLSKDSMLQLRRDRGPLAKLWRFLSRTLGLPPVVTLWDAYDIGWSSQGVLHVPGDYWATYYDDWRGVVERFTERQITSRQDRLPALSGLADEFQRATGGVYIAGMWKEELIESLAWTVNNLYNANGEYGTYPGHIPPSNFVVGPYPESVKPPGYVAPSWSWASTQGRVTFFQGTYQINRSIKRFAKVNNIQVVPKYSTDTLGALAGGSLTLTAPFLPFPDPQSPCPEDYTLRTVHSYIRRQKLQRGDSFTTEFYQHHEPHAGQEFALLKLFEEKARVGQVGSRVYMLLLESTGNGGWRRLTCTEVLIVTLQELERDNFQYMDLNNDQDREYMEHLRPALRESAEMAREVKEAAWAKRRVTLY